jgi:hypothetical protein
VIARDRKGKNPKPLKHGGTEEAEEKKLPIMPKMPKNPKLKTKPEICLAFLAISCRNHPITGSPDFFIPPLTPLTLRCKGFGFSIFTVWQFWHFWQFPAGITRSPDHPISSFLRLLR